LLEQCVDDAPGYFDAWNNLGVVARRMDDMEAAEGYFRMALRLRPEAYEPHANLAEALSALEKRDEALAMAKRALRIRPKDAGANAMVGIQYFLAGRYAECVPYLEAAAQTDPRSYFYPQISLSVAYEKLGRLEAAAKSLEDWLTHHTTNPDRPVVEAKHRELRQAALRAESLAAQ
jgi:tetratricopeptide (TPR) repeat protein